MSLAVTGGPPEGWYPDPAGDPQWRRWTGTDWSGELTPYGPSPTPPSERLELIRAQDHLARVGVASYFSGLGLLVDAGHHQFVTAYATSRSVNNLLEIVALVLLFIGHLSFARAGAVLAGPHRWLCALPFVNVLAWTWWAWWRATYPLPVARQPAVHRREVAESALATQCVLFIALGAYATWPLPSSPVWSAVLHLVPAIPAAFAIRWARLLRDDLVG